MRRRTFLRNGAAFLGAAGGIGGYIGYLEPRAIEYTEKTLGRGGSGSIRLLHLSDFHVASAFLLSLTARAIKIGLAQKPDIVCLTGDYITRSIFEGLAEQIARVAAEVPTYAVLGNHDGGFWAAEHGGYDSGTPVVELLTSSGVTVLQNRSQVVTVRSRKLRLVGVADLWSDEHRPDLAFAEAGEDDLFRIVLCHNPDAKGNLRRYSWDLLLSGHTHGGQFQVPLTGAAPFAPVHDRRFIEGLHRWEGRQLHVTRGIGGIFGGIRAFCPPEVSMLVVGEEAFDKAGLDIKPVL